MLCMETLYSKIPPVVLSYIRTFVAATLTLYLTGERDFSALWAAGVAAVIPPILRWLDSSDTAFGRGASE